MSVVIPPDCADTLDEITLHPHHDCPAIDRCCQAWYDMYEKAHAQGSSGVMARLRANAAYRFAMPPLNSLENVRDFVACVLHGNMARTILPDLASRLLYGAQVATSIVKAMQKTAPRRPSKHEESSVGASTTAPSPAVSLSDCEQAPHPEPQPVAQSETRPSADPSHRTISAAAPENRPPSPTVPLSDCVEVRAPKPQAVIESETGPTADPASRTVAAAALENRPPSPTVSLCGCEEAPDPASNIPPWPHASCRSNSTSASSSADQSPGLIGDLHGQDLQSSPVTFLHSPFV